MTLAQILAALAACGGLQTPSAVESAMREAAASPERDFRQLIDLVRAAVGAAIYPTKSANDRWVSLTAIYADRAIVELGGRKYQYAYTVAATPSGDQVTLTAPVEVVETYVPTVPADKTVLRESLDVACHHGARHGDVGRFAPRLPAACRTNSDRGSRWRNAVHRSPGQPACPGRYGQRPYSGTLGIPKSAISEHPLVAIIGLENLLKLGTVYGGEDHFQLPKAERAFLALRNASIAERYASSKTDRLLAIEYGLTEGQIVRIVSAMGVAAPADRRQKALF